jgi:FkbM family methyltransferase
MRQLILKLASFPTIRNMVIMLRLHVLANWWLRRFPVVKTLPGTDIRYRARRLDSLSLSVVMFDRAALYPTSELPANIRTFADLGCNVGYFTCWLCQQVKGKELRGLMVDANSEVIDDARWHVETNGWREIHVLQGFVGTSSPEQEVEFFVNASTVFSTAVPPEQTKDTKSSWRRVTVPCVCIEQNWQNNFGDAPCDLLKLDIEGSEMDFFRNETGFLRRVQTILIEWHKWRVSLAEIEQFLGQHGFVVSKILHEEQELGTAIFVRKGK